MSTLTPLHRHAGTRKPHVRVIGTVCRECTAGYDLLACLQGQQSHPINRGWLCARGSAFACRLDRAQRTMTRRRPDGGLEVLGAGWTSGKV
jgi:hypothetical protein